MCHSDKTRKMAEREKPMALVLYGRKDSINVQKVLWLLTELGTEFDVIEKGGAFGGLRTKISKP